MRLTFFPFFPFFQPISSEADVESPESTEQQSSSSSCTEQEIDWSLLDSVIGEMSKRTSRRGPNAHCSLRFDYTAPNRTPLDSNVPLHSDTAAFMEIHGYLLAMRGEMSQPLFERNSELGVDRAFVWNGEAFRAPFIKPLHCLADEKDDSRTEENDSQKVFEMLRELAPSDALELVEGPWATVYYSAKENAVYFARDPRGRRSLMVGNVKNRFLIISSIPWKHEGLPIEWIEVDTKGIYKYDCDSGEITLSAWRSEVSQIAQRLAFTSPEDTYLSTEVVSQQLMDVLRESVRRRVHFRGDGGPKTKIYEESLFGASLELYRSEELMEGSAQVAVLFSGGLDSTVLAALVDKEIGENQEIDLINVAFGNEAQCRSAPDRVTCLQSYADLLRINPNRRWRLNLISIEKSELEHFTPQVASLMFPNNTLMDISISAPLWFASRGIGKSTVIAGEEFCEENLKPFVSRAKVLIIGAGADEQFAGYGRHRVAFRRGGWQALQDELDKDIKRLWKRNLGRDDRVLSDHSKEARFPFLDADVMQWVSSKYLPEIVNFELPPGFGDKLALRKVAEMLGLKAASILPKRAIQFGTKITKQMPRGKGTDNFDA